MPKSTQTAQNPQATHPTKPAAHQTQQQQKSSSPALHPKSPKQPAGKSPQMKPGDHKHGKKGEAHEVEQQMEQLVLDDRHCSLRNKAADIVSAVKPCKVEMLKSSTQQCDVCILLDITEGMEDPLNALRQCMDDYVKDLKSSEFKDWDFRTCFVGYRDISDGKQQLNIGQLVPIDQVDVLKDDLKNMEAKGGGEDVCEDVTSALEAVVELHWRPDASCRVMVHIADAPNHGPDMHEKTGVADGHVKGTAVDTKTVVENLGRKKIDYHFLKLNNSTDLMIKKFNQWLTAARPGSSIKTTQLQGTYLNPPELCKYLVDSIHASVKYAIKTGGKK